MMIFVDYPTHEDFLIILYKFKIVRTYVKTKKVWT